MKYLLCAILSALLLVPFSQESRALSKKQKEAFAICTAAYNNKRSDCGEGKKNPNDVDSCLRKADAFYARCTRKAAQMAPVQSQPGDTNSDVPVLSTD